MAFVVAVAGCATCLELPNRGLTLTDTCRYTGHLPGYRDTGVGVRKGAGAHQSMRLVKQTMNGGNTEFFQRYVGKMPQRRVSLLAPPLGSWVGLGFVMVATVKLKLQGVGLEFTQCAAAGQRRTRCSGRPSRPTARATRWTRTDTA